MRMFLDLIDIQILDLLKENSRSRFTELGDQLNLTPAAIKYRIDRLVKDGITDKFTILINRKKVGFEVLAFLVVYAVSRIHVATIVEALKNFSEISKISVLMGDPDMLAEICVINMNNLIRLLKDVSDIEEIQTFKTWFVMDVIHWIKIFA